MKTLFRRRAEANQALIANASSLMGTTVVNSALGFVYWWLAARLFPPPAVGLASAAVSAMMLLGNIGMLGMGTWLIGELPRRPSRGPSLIATALAASGTVAGGLGVVLAVAAPRLSADLRPLAASLPSIALFALGVSLTAVGLVLDQALIGLLRGGVQLWRNALVALIKLVALLALGLWADGQLGLAIYATWVLGTAVSLLAVAGFVARRGTRIRAAHLRWRLLHEIGRPAITHHALNLALQAPGMILPLIVTIMLSARLNASFYIAWMAASFIFMAPAALTTVLYAVSAGDATALARRLRLTLGLSAALGALATAALLPGAGILLGTFGQTYSQQAAASLRMLGLGVFPLTVKLHYVALCRIQNRIPRAAQLMAAGGLLELVAAAIGAGMGGLSGLSLGWLLALGVEAAVTAPAVYLTAHAGQRPLRE